MYELLRAKQMQNSIVVKKNYVEFHQCQAMSVEFKKHQSLNLNSNAMQYVNPMLQYSDMPNSNKTRNKACYIKALAPFV